MKRIHGTNQHINYNYEKNIDELAIPFLNIIKSCKNEIEE
jgi:hypothetical protein